MQTWYHATSKSNWQKIQDEGVLWGVRNAPSRCTYLARDILDVIDGRYGDVILEVEFDPKNDKPNNHHPDGWQCRVYAPIPISRICLL